MKCKQIKALALFSVFMVKFANLKAKNNKENAIKEIDELKKEVTMKLAEELFIFFSSLLRKQATGCSCGTQFRIFLAKSLTKFKPSLEKNYYISVV